MVARMNQKSHTSIGPVYGISRLQITEERLWRQYQFLNYCYPRNLLHIYLNKNSISILQLPKFWIIRNNWNCNAKTNFPDFLVNTVSKTTSKLWKDLNLQYPFTMFCVMYIRELLNYKVSLIHNSTKLHLRDWLYGGLMDSWTAATLLMSSASQNNIKLISYYTLYILFIYLYTYMYNRYIPLHYSLLFI